MRKWELGCLWACALLMGLTVGGLLDVMIEKTHTRIVLEQAPEPLLSPVKIRFAPGNLIEEAKKVRRLQGVMGHGSCVPVAWVGEWTAVLTARHCCESDICFTIDELAVEKAIQHTSLDVALLWVRGKLPLVPLEAELSVGAPMHMVGYPSDEDWFISDGRVCAPGASGRGTQMSSASVWYGMSGGATLNDQGRCIGIQVEIEIARGKEVPTISFFVPYVSFQDWLAEQLAHAPK